jgi:hypothetical protein
LFFGTARAARRVPIFKRKFFLILIQVGQRMSYPLCYHNPMMKMKEQLLDHAKRVAWKKWKSVEVEPAPFHTNAKEEFGEFVR